MAVVFHILIALLASPGQSGAVTTTNSSSLSAKRDVSTSSAYLSPKHNYTSTFGAGGQAHSRVSATRSGVTTVAAVNTNRSGGGHCVPTPTATADRTGNAASLNSESKTLPASVTSESVAVQAADSQTARGTTSSVKWIDETVTYVSENAETVDTVPGSVHLENDSDDIPSETVLTTLATTTTTTAVPSIVASSCPRSPVTSVKDCEVMLCEKDAGYFVINTTACPAKQTPKMDTTVPTTVEILTSEVTGRPETVCNWTIKVRYSYFVNVTIEQLMLEVADHNGTPALQFDLDDDSRYLKLAFNASVLRSRSVTFTSTSSLHFRFRGQHLHFASPIRFHFLVQRGAIVRDLPVVRLTDTVGYVTSPRFNGLDNLYFNSFDGDFHLQLLDNESVLISFVHFALEKKWERCYDYLDFNVTASSHSWRKCGTQNIPSGVYRSSVHLFFHSSSWGEGTGFKMMYAILPRSQEPQQQLG